MTGTRLLCHFWHAPCLVHVMWTCHIPPQGDAACMTHIIHVCVRCTADQSQTTCRHIFLCICCARMCACTPTTCARSHWVQPELMFVLSGGGQPHGCQTLVLCISKFAHRIHIQPQYCGKHRHANAGMGQRGNGGDIFPMIRCGGKQKGCFS